MAFVNEIEKQIVVKVVYYGTDLSGKRSTFRFLHDMLGKEQRGRFLRLARKDEAVLFLDGAPEDLDKVGPYSPRVHLYTPLNDIKDPTTLTALFRGADAAVFVADAQEERLDENRRALDAMKNILARLETPLDGFPFVMQFDKLDLPGALSEEDLDEELNEQNVPFYAANAVTGVRLEEVFTAAVKLGLRKIAGEFKARAFKGWFKFTATEALLKKNFDTIEDYAPEMERDAFESVGALETPPMANSGGKIAEFGTLNEKEDFAELDALLEATDSPASPESAQDAEGALDALFSEGGDEEDETDPLAGEDGGAALLADNLPAGRSKPTSDFTATVVSGAAAPRKAAPAPPPGGGMEGGRTVRVNRDALGDLENAAKSLGLDDDDEDIEASERTFTATLRLNDEGPHVLTIPVTLPSPSGKDKTVTLRIEITYKT